MRYLCVFSFFFKIVFSKIYVCFGILDLYEGKCMNIFFLILYVEGFDVFIWYFFIFCIYLVVDFLFCCFIWERLGSDVCFLCCCLKKILNGF